VGADNLRHVSTHTAELPLITAVIENSLAWKHGLRIGDQVQSINGVVPRDLIEWQSLTSDFPLELCLLRNGEQLEIQIEPANGDGGPLPFGAQVHSAVFDRVQTCDNHCEFCFIYQLPKGMRRSLYLKDDDYRLSFLYGNFTTLTRFTEADLERVVSQHLSPLFVSVHSMNPHVRSEMLRNERGGVSLRWLRQLLNHRIDVRLQIVLCPGVNDGKVLEHTLGSLLEEMPEVSSIAVVPLGLSKHNTEARMRVHTPIEAREALDLIEKWQARFFECLGRHVLHAGDELYLVAGKELPPRSLYGDWEMLEDGIGLARRFIDSFNDPGIFTETNESSNDHGFFASVDTASSQVASSQVVNPTQYIRTLNPAADTSLRPQVQTTTDNSLAETKVVHIDLVRKGVKATSLGILTGKYGAEIMRPLLGDSITQQVHIHEVNNHYFGGNTAVAGLMTFEDICGVLHAGPKDRLYLLPDVCLNEGRFLDGHTINELKETFNVRVIPASGAALREQIELFFSDSSVS
jgi:putative radical SAM enzyme (TIGR03279 family)